MTAREPRPISAVARSARYRRAHGLERVAGCLRRLPVRGIMRERLRSLYHRALLLGSPGGLTCVLPEGERVVISPRYRYLTWHPAEVDSFKRAVGPGATAIDVGANVGCYALLLARWVGRAGRVVAFEPEQEALVGLRYHARLNDVDDVLRAERLAVSNRTATAPWASAAGGTGHLAAPGETADVSVPTTTIDAFCDRERLVPDFIKVDAEGGELAVLEGARETIAATAGHLGLFVEMHPSRWPALGISRADLEHELRRQGLRAEPIDASQAPWVTEGLAVRLVPRRGRIRHRQ